ncbi:hypothetical protein TI39_contig334g00005 [Zymoseptoria brevis]|uniref:Uncharacterized protein n=1 Tax=Zymoseptoria brevis TaxID=1047168 RepID=A0A0F4GVV2_9PEZI|nr:hypothetical protein TI39_contig334g00005 [Zymoseptoria brevis]
MQKAHHAQKLARLRPSLPPQLWMNNARARSRRPTIDPDNQLSPSHDAERALSTSSFDSANTEANLGDFSANTSDLIKRDRALQTIEKNLDDSEETLKAIQYRVDSLRAALMHIPRRSGDVETEALDARKNAELDLAVAERQPVLAYVERQEKRRDKLLRLQAEQELLVMRTAGGVIRNSQRADPAEGHVSSAVRYQLRLLADCGRAYAVNSNAISKRIPVISNDRGPDGELLMNPSFEAHLRKEVHKFRMRNFLELMEPIHFESGGLTPQENEGAKRKRIEDEIKLDQARRKEISDQVDAGVKAMEEAHNEAEVIRQSYSLQKDLHFLTYERDVPADSELGHDHYEWKHRRRMDAAVDKIRKAEAQHREAVNQALEAKVPHRREDLLGILDHENDGFTSTMGSTYQNKLKVQVTAEKGRMDRWLGELDTSGRGYGVPDIPYDVADIETGSDIRCGLSTRWQPIQFESDLKARWAAEVIVMRAEAEKQRQEIYDHATRRR